MAMNLKPRQAKKHPLVEALAEFYDPVFRQPFLWCGLALQACLITAVHPDAQGWTKVAISTLTGAAAICAAYRWWLQLRATPGRTPRKS